MGAKKTVLLLAIIALLASIPSAIAAQPKALGDSKAWKMLQLAYRAQEKANQTIVVAEGSGLTGHAVEDAEAAYARGEASLALANQTFYAIRGEAPLPPGDNPTPERVQELALQAMHEFKAAMAAIMAEMGGPDESARPRGLEEAITRAELYVEKVSASVEALGASKDGYDFTEADERIAEAELHIGYARGNLTVGDINGTARELGQIRQSLSGLQGELHKLTRSPKLAEKRIGAFLEKQLAEKMDEAKRLAETAGTDKTAELAEVNARMDAARQAAQSGNVKDALSLTREAHRLLMNILSELHRGRGRP